MEIHLHVHEPADPAIATTLSALLDRMSTLEQTVQTHRTEDRMAAQDTKAQFAAVISRIDTATNTLADKLRAMADQIATSGMPEGDETTFASQLIGIADRLESIGADPNNPVPPEPTAPPTEPTEPLL